MNTTHIREANQKAASAKFNGKKTVVSKYVPRYPNSPEREMKRVTNAYMRVVNRELKKKLPALMKRYRANRYDDIRYDDWQDFKQSVQDVFQDIHGSLEQAFSKFGLRDHVESVGKKAKKSILREWLNAVKRTLGFTPQEEYYEVNYYTEAMERWV